MFFYQPIQLKNGQKCILRNAEASDAVRHHAYFVQTHRETDFLLTYPDECKQEITVLERQLKETKCSETDVEICAFVDGKLVGSAGNSLIRNCDKMRHRAEFGISIEKEYWGLGIGDALTKACIECAKNAGFLQLELEVVSENESAINLYKKHGFVEYGRNPRGFRCRDGHWQELILMRLELTALFERGILLAEKQEGEHEKA